ncbi:MAG: YheT family hydrolase [Myxococcales bacterium]
MSYEPARWLASPHLMTIYGRLARLPPRLPFRRERWELPDGDFLDVDRLERSPAAPLLVVLHGLEGSSSASYVRGLAAEAFAQGLSSLAVSFRGCSGQLNRLARFYHSGDTGDLAQVLSRLVAERPGRPLLLAGFSLGGNVAAKLLGERGGDLPASLRAAAVISAPFDLARCAQALDGGGRWARLYRGLFLRSLRRKAIAKAKLFPGNIDADAAARARTLREFDDWITAPLHGFASASDYWARSSSGPLLGSVARPLLAIAAADDPFVPAEALPVAAAAANPRVTLEVTAAGGHLAFVSGAPWSPWRWAERRAIEFLLASL